MARYGIVQKASLYREGVGIAISHQEVDRITAAKAADEMINIADITASFVLFPSTEGSMMVSARSIGDVNVQVISEILGGGGNAAAAGAQMKGLSLEEAEVKLKEAIDRYFEEL
jgi:c-di-AMP phosphodiesterase-like protein